MPKMKKFHFCACSFGKDSLATVLLALHHNEPLDEVVFTEVMYDNQRGISGEDPRHIEWVNNRFIFAKCERFEDYLNNQNKNTNH